MAFAITPPKSAQSESKPLFPSEGLVAFALVTGLFFLWGVANNLNDVLIRQFMKSFEITRLQAGSGAVCFLHWILRFFDSGGDCYAAARLQVWTDHRAVAVWLGNVSLSSRGRGGKLFPFSLALFVIASGLGFLETGANPLITQLGDPGSAVRRLNFSQAFNPIGSIAGVLIGTVFIFSGVELKAPDIARLKVAGTYNAYLHHETMRVVPPYMVIGAVVLLWALLIFLTPFPAVAGAQSAASDEAQGSYRALLRYPHFLLAVVAQFCYVGAQVGTWSYFIQYVQDYTHLPEKTAGYFLTGTLAGFGVGRFGSSHWMKLVRASTLMGIFAVANIVLVAIGIVYPGWVGVWAIFLTSFFMSLMFPTIFALGIQDLGPNTKQGASLLVMSIIGGALITLLVGLVSQVTRSMAMAMGVPLLCYLCVGYYAFWGYRIPPRSEFE